ncbi:MAG: DUF805 domain-containing protein [Flavobacteriaceae bacterium]
MNTILKKTEADYNMIDWWKKVVMENYANFEGRARRSEYWYYALFNFLIILAYGIIVLIAGVSMGDNSTLFILLMVPLILFALALLVPSIAVAVRRLHDTGKSGWWYLIGVIPVVSYIGGIVLLVFYCMDSNPGSNQYGPNPKTGNVNEIEEIGKEQF